MLIKSLQLYVLLECIRLAQDACKIRYVGIADCTGIWSIISRLAIFRHNSEVQQTTKVWNEDQIDKTDTVDMHAQKTGRLKVQPCIACQVAKQSSELDKCRRLRVILIALYTFKNIVLRTQKTFGVNIPQGLVPRHVRK